MKIWEHTAAELRAVDIGSHKGPQFTGRARSHPRRGAGGVQGPAGVLVELKSYGHNQRLEEKVAEIVEAAGMEKDCIYMSLDHYQVGRMKRLRPPWRVGRAGGQGARRPHDARRRLPRGRGAHGHRPFRAAGAPRATGRLRVDGQRPGMDAHAP